MGPATSRSKKFMLCRGHMLGTFCSHGATRSRHHECTKNVLKRGLTAETKRLDSRNRSSYYTNCFISTFLVFYAC
uniref:Uncharacterized protein n=1 Tax=Hyaloperonospora arabidopsidis (strain Emoy2) TaxID=559515 RepID=M4BT54_HYAAE